LVKQFKLKLFTTTAVIKRQRYGYGEIRIWLNVPLKDISIERVRVEEFGESKDKDCG